MEIEFSKHAMDQRKVRTGITKSIILETIKHPKNVSTSYRGRGLYSKQYGQQLLEVVAVKEDNKLIVITAYLLEK